MKDYIKMLEHYVIGDYSLANLKCKIIADIEVNNGAATLAIEQFSSHPIMGRKSKQIILEGEMGDHEFMRKTVRNLQDFNNSIEKIYEDNFKDSKKIPIDFIINPLDLFAVAKNNILRIKLNFNLIQDNSLTSLEKFYGVMTMRSNTEKDWILTGEDKEVLKNIARSYLIELSKNYSDYRAYVSLHPKEAPIEEGAFTPNIYAHLIKNNITYNYVNAHNIKTVLNLISTARVKLSELSRDEFIKIFQLHAFINGNYKKVPMGDALDNVITGSGNRLGNVYSSIKESEYYLTQNASENMKKNVVNFCKLDGANYLELTSMTKPYVIELLQKIPVDVKGVLVNDVFQAHREFTRLEGHDVLNGGVNNYLRIIEKFPKLSRTLHLEIHSILVGMAQHSSIISYFMHNANALNGNDYEGLEKLTFFTRDDVVHLNSSFIVSNLIVGNFLNSDLSISKITEFVKTIKSDHLKTLMDERKIINFQLSYSKKINEYIDMPLDWVLELYSNE